ncbi:MAG: hypothetical protein EPN82_05035 [Bacteroidetes bacterium]|nr:MAG: hypothetical protein EPN82_05035 [Bacteroidota bacterium]
MKSVSFRKKSNYFLLMFICLFFLCLSEFTKGQVPFSTVKKDLLKDWKGVTITDRGGGHIAVDESVFPNRRYYVAFARVDSKEKIEGHDAVHHRDLEVYYDIVGGKYVFNSYAKFASWYTGDLVPPTFELAAKLLSPENSFEIFDSYSLGYLTDYEGIKEISKEKYTAYDGSDNFYYSGESAEKKVWFKVKIVFSQISGNKIEKREALVEIGLGRDGINTPWKIVIGGLGVVSAGTVIESRELSDEESKEMDCNTLKAKVNIKKSLENFNKLPVVDIPKFTKAMEMTWWIHKYLMNAKPAEAEYVFLKLLQPWYFLSCGNYMLNEEGYKLIENVKKMVADERCNYGKQYCENPKIKEQSGNDQDYQVAFYQKTGPSFSRIRVGTFKGELKISSINPSWNSSKEYADEIANLPAGTCKEGPMAFWKTYKLDEFAIQASFPGEPKSGNGKNLQCNFGGIEYFISGEPVSIGGGGGLLGKFTKAIPKADAKSLSEATKSKYRASVENEGVWQIRGARGYDATWSANKEGSIAPMRYRSVIFKDILYQIWVLGNAATEDVNQFFESVSIYK